MRNDFIIRGGVAVVELTQGRSMRVAEEALPTLALHRWRAHRKRHTFYAAAHVRRPDGRLTKLYAHRLLCGLDFGDPREADHIDGDGLNNLPSNLRITDNAGNVHNRHGKQPHRHGETPTSRFPGVYWEKDRAEWRASIGLNGRSIHLGRYAVEEDAAEAYLRAKVVRDAGGSRDEIRAARRVVSAPTSRFPGVCWERDGAKWRAQIELAGRNINLGRYTVEENAADAYRRAKTVRDAGGTYDEIRATRRTG
jgi:hypothetical protein